MSEGITPPLVYISTESKGKILLFFCSSGFSLLSDSFKFFSVLSCNSEDFYVLGSRDSVVGLVIGKET
jgi:hypothetical protein